MSYILTPFNTNVKYQNQVKTELSLANTNFTLLGQAFLNNDPTQPILRAVYIGATAPTNPVADMLWFDTSTNILKLYDGTNWKAINDFSSLNNSISSLNSQVVNLNNNVSNLNSQVNTINSNVNTLNSAFFNNDPTSQPILRAVYIGSTAPTNPVAGTTWLDTSATPPVLKVYDGSAWQSNILNATNSDKVDGFHASQTPAANTIVPLNSSGILDLSKTYVKSDVYTIRRVDLSNATSDYNLQVGEEVIINFTNATSVPLHIATQSGTYYEMDVVVSNNVGTSGVVGGPVYLNPNNTTYSNAFSYVEVFRSSEGLGSAIANYSAFRLGWAIGDIRVYLINFTTHKSVKGQDMQTGTADAPVVHSYASQWNDTTTAWTSLGTITFPQSTSGYILVRRLA